MEELFSKVLQVAVRCKDSEERKTLVRVTIELHKSSPAHRQDLLVTLTDDKDPFFLFKLSISEEDFQSLKVQQGLLVDFGSFPQKFIDLLNLCSSEQESESPRFLLQLFCASAVLDGPVTLGVVETNAFKHLNHLSLRLAHGSDREIKEFPRAAEKQSLEQSLQRTEENLSRQLAYAQQVGLLCTPLKHAGWPVGHAPLHPQKGCRHLQTPASPRRPSSGPRSWQDRRVQAPAVCRVLGCCQSPGGGLASFKCGEGGGCGQTLTEKTKELEKLRSEWTSQSSHLSSRHSQEMQSEREKSLEVSQPFPVERPAAGAASRAPAAVLQLQARLQQQSEQLRQDLEGAHRRSSQQLHSRLTELEASCKDLTERRYKNESVIRDLKMKLVGAEEEGQRLKQQLLSLRRENGTLDAEVHEKERLVNQLQMKVAVLEQEVTDKEQLMRRTREVLEAAQQQKESVEESAESKDVQIKKLEATVKSLSEELIKGNGIIKKLQGEVRGLVGKIKVKNSVTVSQERLLKDTADKLQAAEKELESTGKQLLAQEEQVCS
ncbi:unnamed protein product, partial [Tetraodon nigroviridis]